SIFPGERVTIIGLSEAFLPALIRRYRLAPPAHHVPPIGFEADAAAMARAVAFVRAHPSRFVFLAVGSPRQEYLAAALAAAGDITGTGLCIGAGLEFLAGARRRAPELLQHLCLEWLFRLLHEPARLARRYLVRSPAVIGLLLRQRLGGRIPR
ncbi:MAG TPA: WecB/TagA/CpsF family glycosyltransferase, partial [Rhodopila sp.]|nr:WecB/TagA/CpsF family glycosyltransferase [Rhodopila sp.]